MKVSVIIPIYKVERFIGRCAESLMKQTLSDVEYIFVNDATPDRSMDVLNSILDGYPEKKKYVHVLSHNENKGLPAARNTGLSVARGEYVFHCDSDDYVEYDILERMYEVAHKYDCDIVWSDWFLTFNKSDRYMKQPHYVTAKEALDGILKGAMKYNVWNKLVKRSLYTDNSISFPSGYGMGEDMTMIMLFVHAKKVASIPQAFYHYVKLNEESFSNTYSQKHLQELLYNVNRTTEYLIDKLGDKVKDDLNFFKLEVKFPFLITDNFKKYGLWKEWFPESNKYAFKNKSVSLRRRLLQTMASHGQWWFVRSYYFLIYKCNIITIIK